MVSSQAQDDQMEGITTTTTTTMDAVYECTADALTSLATSPLKRLKHTNETQQTPPLLVSDSNRKNKNQKSGDLRLPPSGCTMILSLLRMTTNMGTKSDDDQIET